MVSPNICTYPRVATEIFRYACKYACRYASFNFIEELPDLRVFQGCRSTLDVWVIPLTAYAGGMISTLCNRSIRAVQAASSDMHLSLAAWFRPKRIALAFAIDLGTRVVSKSNSYPTRGHRRNTRQ